MDKGRIEAAAKAKTKGAERKEAVAEEAKTHLGARTQPAARPETVKPHRQDVATPTRSMARMLGDAKT